MLAQEKEEHKIATLSRATDKRDTECDKVAIRGLPALLDCQPAGEQRGERGEAIGWSTEAVSEVDSYSDFDFRFATKAKVFAPVSNTGATPPPSTTKIDTISLSARELPSTLVDLLVESLQEQYRGEQVSWLGKGKGINGYKLGIALLVNKREVASVYHGCDHNERQNEKPQIYIGGNGATDHFDFFKMREYLNQVESPNITRADISKDWYFGEVSLDDIKNAYVEGKFKNLNAPKNPKWTPIGAPNPIDGSHQGITYQIGSRDSAYFYRAYLKGYERLKSLLNCDNETIVHRIMETNGMIAFDEVNNGEAFDVRKWLRGELELKAKNNNKLDLDVIVKPDNFYSGAYPFLSELINVGDGMRPKYLKKEDELDMSVRIQNAKAISGNTIEDMLFLGYTNEEIVRELRSGKGASQKLIKAGLAQKRVNELNKQI